MIKEQVIHDRWRQLGFEKLLPEEQDYIMIWWLIAEVNNGSFAQYFGNETGDHAGQALDGLKKCGALERARLLQQAMDLFLPYGGYTPDWNLRNDRIDELESHPRTPAQGAFREVSSVFQTTTEPTIDLALLRIEEAFKRLGIDP